MSTKYKLVRISLEEYRILFDAGAWVYGDDIGGGDWVIKCESDSENPRLREAMWTYCYTRVEQEQS